MADEVWPVVEEALCHWRKVQVWIVQSRWVTVVEKAHAQQAIVVLDKVLAEHAALGEMLAEPTVEPEPSPFDQRARRLWDEYVEPYDDNLWEGSFSAFVDELRKSPLVLVERQYSDGRYVVSLHEDPEGVAADIDNGSGWETRLIVNVETGERFYPHVVVEGGDWRWP